EYKALQNQIAHDNFAKSKVEEETLLALEALETRTAELGKLEAEVKRFSTDVEALKQQIDADALAHSQKLREIETAIVEAETVIPGADRDRYRRILGRYGADALASCEDGACHGCFTSIPPQIINDLINGETLCFCLSCGRLLYIGEPEIANT